MLPARTARTVFLTAVILSLSSAHAAVPDYKFGDVAVADVITPVPLIVVNPEATEALKQKVAQQVPFIVRHTGKSAAARARSDGAADRGQQNGQHFPGESNGAIDFGEECE
jgi:hypothetical protein